MLEDLQIVYLSVGSGHQFAALAIDLAAKRHPTVRSQSVDPFSEHVPTFTQIANRLQKVAQSRAVRQYDRAWRDDRWSPLWKLVTNSRVLKYPLVRFLKENRADAIVCTHVLPLAFLACMRKELGKTKVYGVVTDYGLHAHWPMMNVDGYFVAHESLREELVNRGFDYYSIHPTGIPLRPTQSWRQHNERRKYPLKVLLIAGGLRSSAYVSIQKSTLEFLEKLLVLPNDLMKLTVVVGNQSTLGTTISDMVGSLSQQIGVQGYVENLHELIAEHHIVITKPGGMILAESLSAGVVLILTGCGGGQERENQRFLVKHGAALTCDSPEDLESILATLAAKPELLEAMQRSALHLGRPRAAEDIVRTLISECDPGRTMEVEPTANRLYQRPESDTGAQASLSCESWPPD